MAPERAAHARRKAEIWLALRDGIKAGGLSCEALPDGMTVKIDEHTAYEPDAVVHCGEALADDAVIVPAPVIVVEVLSPSTAARDTGAKLADYFRPAERVPLPDRQDGSADRDPSSPRRRRGHRDPDRHGRRAAARSARHHPRSRPHLRLRRAAPALAPGSTARAILGGEEAARMAKALDKPSLYETDYVAWLDEQAAHLRAGRLAELDVENVAEELESLMTSERRELREPARSADPASAQVGSSAGPAIQPMARDRGRSSGGGSGAFCGTARA